MQVKLLTFLFISFKINLNNRVKIMSDIKDSLKGQYIAKIILDEATIARRSPQIEHEKKVAILDIIEFNRFAIHSDFGNFTGPYHLYIGIRDNKLILKITHCDNDDTIKEFFLSLSPLKSIIKDYHEICASYFNAINTLTASQIETIDMARRGIHDEASDILTERLNGKIIMDKMTARRIFSLISILHMAVLP